MKTIMNKIAVLSDEQYKGIIKDGSLGQDIRELLGIPKTKKVNIGDTVCVVGQPSNTKDVFKYTHNNKDTFYVVISPIDETTAMCYSLWSSI